MGSKIWSSNGQAFKGDGKVIYLLAVLPLRSVVILLYFYKLSSPWSPLGKKISGYELKGRSICHGFHGRMQGTWRRSCLSPPSADTAEKIKLLGFVCLHMVSLTMRMYT